MKWKRLRAGQRPVSPALFSPLAISFHWILVTFRFFHQVFRPTMLTFRVCDVWRLGSRKSSSWLALEFLCQQTCPTFAPREDFTISCGIQQTSPLQRPFSPALWLSLTEFYSSLCGLLCFDFFPSLDRLVPARANRVERELCQASFSERIHSCSSKWCKSSEWMRSAQLWRMHSSRFCRTSACWRGPCTDSLKTLMHCLRIARSCSWAGAKGQVD